MCLVMLNTMVVSMCFRCLKLVQNWKAFWMPTPCSSSIATVEGELCFTQPPFSLLQITVLVDCRDDTVPTSSVGLGKFMWGCL